MYGSAAPEWAEHSVRDHLTPEVKNLPEKRFGTGEGNVSAGTNREVPLMGDPPVVGRAFTRPTRSGPLRSTIRITT